jgi:hypothetical protein
MIDEARGLLPWLRERLARIRALFQDMSERGFDIVKGRWGAKGNGHGQKPPPEEYGEFISLIAELDMRGVLIKDFVQGVVDFPHITEDGEEVYLCWMAEEQTISYWHGITEGFMGRMPVEEKPRES